MGALVGLGVGALVGLGVGALVGCGVGDRVGLGVGDRVGLGVGSGSIPIVFPLMVTSSMYTRSLLCDASFRKRMLIVLAVGGIEIVTVLLYHLLFLKSTDLTKSAATSHSPESKDDSRRKFSFFSMLRALK